MKKNIITETVNIFLKSQGFKKRGNAWTMHGEDISKIIILQKSTFEDRYYINYGFILNKLPLDGLSMHIFIGLGSMNVIENDKIQNILNMNNTILDTDRVMEIEYILKTKVLHHFEKINAEADLLYYLDDKKHLNNIPLAVKNYLNLPFI